MCSTHGKKRGFFFVLVLAKFPLNGCFTISGQHAVLYSFVDVPLCRMNRFHHKGAD